MSEIAEKTKVHHGNNLYLLRREQDKKQDVVAKDLGLSQKRISQLESQESISDDVLQRFADYFSRPLEEIRDTEVELRAMPINIHDVTIEEGSNVIFGNNNNDVNNGNNYNSKELILELCAEKDRQIEKLFTSLNHILEIDKQQREELTKLLAKK